MALNLQTFSSKLRRYREQLNLSIPELANATGIEESRIESLEAGRVEPTGDEVLIFADFYKCDYRFFISNERLAPFEQTENLYRRYGNEFSKEDRWSVQEFLFLCECEDYLMRSFDRPRNEFRFTPKGQYYKGHAQAAAESLRQHLGYGPQAIVEDVYSDFRKIGFHVFRRRLNNSNISGMTIRHPSAGACILVNCTEDIYRQRFTAAHEAAHAILDKEDFVVSLTKDGRELVEIRANTFASRYLVPPAVLGPLSVGAWTEAKVADYANRLKVSAIALAISLKENGFINEKTFTAVSRARIPAAAKIDPELVGVAGKSFERKRILLERGLSTQYVSLCFDALSTGRITNARTAEMLLVSEGELVELARLFQVSLLVHE